MSTSPVPTKPDTQPAPERRPNGAPARHEGGAAQAPPPIPADRTIDADLLIDVAQLSVEELTLELDATLLLDSVKLGAKGLDAALFVKADFEPLQAFAQRHAAHAGHDDGRSKRVRDAAKAAGLAAAGVAGGAVLNSKPWRLLPVPRRRSRLDIVRDEIVKRLP
jgi:hypothetical protein